MKKNTKLLLSALLVILALAVMGIFLQHKNFSVPAKKTTENAQAQKSKVFLSVEENGIPNFASVEISGGETAFDALSKFAAESKIAIGTKKYDMGIFIESIGGIKNGQDGKYWMYYVNGKLADVAADKQELAAGDRIEFKFEKSPY